MAFYYGKLEESDAASGAEGSPEVSAGGSKPKQPGGLTDRQLEAALREMAGKVMRVNVAIIICVLAGLGGFIAVVTSAAIVISHFVLMLVFLLCTGLSYYRYTLKREMKQIFSDCVVRGILTEMLELSEYSPECHIGVDKIDMAALFRGWNTCKGSDLIKGKYKGVGFSFSDIHLEKVTSGRKKKNRTTLFKGQWLICDMHREVPRLLQIRERAFGDGLSKSDAETENVAFNKKFQITTPDPHTAFYVLTPHFMEQIMKIDERADRGITRTDTSFSLTGTHDPFLVQRETTRTYMSFTGKQVHIALHNGRDLFEPCERTILDGKNIPALRNIIKWDVRYIIGIIDMLLRNEYLFKKEG